MAPPAEHAPLWAEMHRVSDEANTVCMTGVYRRLFGASGTDTK
jgi:hypothetical protein